MPRLWRYRAIDMRVWAARVRDPYTKIEMMALADMYERKAEVREKELAIISQSRPQSLRVAGLRPLD
jgi:hypothetical protein